MISRNEKDLNKVKRTLPLYNIFPNLIWSILSLTPISIYCFSYLDYKTFYIFLSVSLIPIFLKKSAIDKLQIGKTVKIYKHLGVHLINRVAQNGVIVNNLIKRKFPNHKTVTTQKSSIAGLISQTYIFEKFHLMLFSFFSLTIVYAFIKGHLTWASIILLTNVAYNIYPNLLQQYIRLKLILFETRINRNSAS
jgi:Glycosyl-4,4'-diaponeurosporenoate acyltransferase